MRRLTKPKPKTKATVADVIARLQQFDPTLPVSLMGPNEMGEVLSTDDLETNILERVLDQWDEETHDVIVLRPGDRVIRMWG